MERTCRVCFAVLCCWAILASSIRAEEGKLAARTPEIVGKILKVDCRIQTSNPPNLVVSATGQVRSGGFSEPTLSRVVYVTPPVDGIQDFIFTAVPPEEAGTAMISELEAANTWKAYKKDAPWIKGVRVRGLGDGIMVKMLDK